MSKAVPSSNREWEVTGAADTLIQAEKIKSDKDLLLKAKAELRRRQEEAQKALKANGRSFFIDSTISFLSFSNSSPILGFTLCQI